MARRRRSAKASASDIAEISSGRASARDRAEAGRGSVKKRFHTRRIKPRRGQG